MKQYLHHIFYILPTLPTRKEIMEFILADTTDLILVPLYFIALSFLLLFIKKKNPDNFLIQKYLMKGFYIKVIGGIIYCLLVLYFWQIGDTMSYYKDTLELRRLLSEGKTNFFEIFFYDYDYFKETFELMGSVNDNGFVVVKVSLLLSYFSLSRFLLTSMLMATVAYAGIFKLFETFVSMAPAYHRIISYFLLFFPSIFLYSSGVLKDTICMSALGWFYYAMHHITFKKNYHWRFFVIAIISFYFIFAVKIYIIAAFFPCYILYAVLQYVSRIKNNLLKIIALPALLTFVVLLYVVNADTIDNSLGAYSVNEIQGSVEGLQNSYMNDQDAGSNFTIGTIEPSLAGIVKKIPVGIVAALYRPFIWEVRKPIMLITALESLFILLFTLYTLKVAGIKRFFVLMFSNSTILLCILFSLLFSGLVGLSTLNFGTLARYRIEAIPFYCMGLLLIVLNSKRNKAAEKVQLKEENAAT